MTDAAKGLLVLIFFVAGIGALSVAAVRFAKTKRYGWAAFWGGSAVTHAVQLVQMVWQALNQPL